MRFRHTHYVFQRLRVFPISQPRSRDIVAIIKLHQAWIETEGSGSTANDAIVPFARVAGVFTLTYTSMTCRILTAGSSLDLSGKPGAICIHEPNTADSTDPADSRELGQTACASASIRTFRGCLLGFMGGTPDSGILFGVLGRSFVT